MPIATFRDLKQKEATKNNLDKKEDLSKKKTDKNEPFYAGAGQQIEGGPSKKKKSSNFANEILQRVEDAGAEKVDPESRKLKATSDPNIFEGKGFKFGIFKIRRV